MTTLLASDWPGAAGGGRGGEYCVPRHAEAVSTGGGAASAGQFCCTYTSENFTMAGEAPRTFSLLKKTQVIYTTYCLDPLIIGITHSPHNNAHIGSHMLGYSITVQRKVLSIFQIGTMCL